MVRKYGLPLLAVVMLCFAVYHVVRAQQQPGKLSPPVQPARSPFADGVAGAGLVEARTENIAVGTNLPGIVTQVFVKVGQPVKKGDRLFRLDDRALRAELRVRKAALAAAEAQLGKLERMPREEEVPALEAKVAEARALFADRQDLAARSRRLYAQRAIGDEERVRTEQSLQVAKEQLRKAEADLALLKAGAWEPDKAIARASVEQAKATLDQTETELKRLEVEALEDGVVLQVNVRSGEYVSAAAGQALIVLGNLNALHVRVDIDEHDIPRYVSAGEARAMLRGDPRQEFTLRFVRVEPYVIPKRSLTGDNTERVDTRVLQVIYEVLGTPNRLYVGQQLDVFINGTPGKKGT
ncbi:MAG: efflux RND transporter periplasmic adaptor subunit [Gemmataceae bacterium]